MADLMNLGRHVSRRVRERMVRRVRQILEDQGDEMAGFVVIGIDRRGAMTTAYDTNDCPIARDILSVAVSRAIDRTAAADMACSAVRAEYGG